MTTPAAEMEMPDWTLTADDFVQMIEYRLISLDRCGLQEDNLPTGAI